MKSSHFYTDVLMGKQGDLPTALILKIVFLYFADLEFLSSQSHVIRRLLN